jgi:hypothetical protein
MLPAFRIVHCRVLSTHHFVQSSSAYLHTPWLTVFVQASDCEWPTQSKFFIHTDFRQGLLGFCQQKWTIEMASLGLVFEGVLEYKEHTTMGAAHTKVHRRCSTKISKRTDILKILKLRTMTMYINEYYWHKRAQCSRFHENVLPWDGPVWPKHVARNRIYFNDILRTF